MRSTVFNDTALNDIEPMANSTRVTGTHRPYTHLPSINSQTAWHLELHWQLIRKQVVHERVKR